MKKRTAVSLLLCTAMAAVDCSASQISLEISPSSEFDGKNVRAGIHVVNNGDEPAYAVQVEAELCGKTARSARRDNIGPGEAAQFAIEIGTAPQPAGIYNIAIRTRYADATGHAYTSVKPISLVSAMPDKPNEQVKAKIRKVRLSARGISLLQLHNTGLTDIPANISLQLPDEFACGNSRQNIALKGGTQDTIPFKVRNKSANPGSIYYAFAVIDYMSEGGHVSTVAGFNIIVDEARGTTAWPTAAAICALLVLLIAVQMFFSGTVKLPPVFRRIFHAAVIVLLLGFLAYYIPPMYLFLDTMISGGDTPAHNYLASHLKDQLLHHGRIVSWAGGWWCGFPMFQFYFCLPYLVTALLSLAIPFNIALKLVSVLGIFTLPLSAFFAARRMRLPDPAPVVSAIAVIPFLFDHTHTMWGVNIYSTFAGMIANSFSFSLMLLFIGCAWRDADDGTFRLTTVGLLVSVIASHFFTTVIACLTAAIIPLLRPRAGFVRAALVLLQTGVLAFILMSWWLAPLIAKNEFTMEFGTNWNMLDKIREAPFFTNMLLLLSPFAVMAAVFAFAERENRPMLVIVWMLVISTVLMVFGYDWNHVFENIRMWPFAVFALLSLEAYGFALLLSNLRAPEIGVAILIVAALTFGIHQPNHVQSWARWNYEGLEGKKHPDVFRKLVEPLKGTPGRLANDLAPENDRLGSTRIFESVPHRIGKPILEGGIVNSAAGSMFSYYIQGETSTNSAGFPSIVEPATFNFTNAVKHLKLFNVRHFIARWERTKQALRESPDWKLLAESEGWELFELATNNTGYVCIPDRWPLGVRTVRPNHDILQAMQTRRLTAGEIRKTLDWKMAGLQWMYHIDAISQPFLILRDDEKVPDKLAGILNADQFMSGLEAGTNATWFAPLINSQAYCITDEKVTDNLITFTTSGPGLPHIIKCAYYPNWKSRNGEPVYMVTPCFMLIFPQEKDVELYYGRTISDYAGMTATGLGILLVLGIAICRKEERRSG